MSCSKRGASTPQAFMGIQKLDLATFQLEDLTSFSSPSDTCTSPSSFASTPRRCLSPEEEYNGNSPTNVLAPLRLPPAATTTTALSFSSSPDMAPPPLKPLTPKRTCAIPDYRTNNEYTDIPLNTVPTVPFVALCTLFGEIERHHAVCSKAQVNGPLPRRAASTPAMIHRPPPTPTSAAPTYQSLSSCLRSGLFDTLRSLDDFCLSSAGQQSSKYDIHSDLQQLKREAFRVWRCMPADEQTRLEVIRGHLQAHYLWDTENSRKKVFHRHLSTPTLELHDLYFKRRQERLASLKPGQLFHTC